RHPSVRPHRRAQSRARPRARLGPYDDSDVLPERGQQPAQPLDRAALEPPPVQVREIWLRDPEAASCRPLRQAPSLNQLLNRVRQVGLGKQLVRVAEPPARDPAAAARPDTRAAPRYGAQCRRPSEPAPASPSSPSSSRQSSTAA